MPNESDQARRTGSPSAVVVHRWLHLNQVGRQTWRQCECANAPSELPEPPESCAWVRVVRRRGAHITQTPETFMTAPTATPSGTFDLGGDLTVNRLGFGAMRITGKGVWGEPADRGEALRVLRRLPELGVNFIDTADSYGPYVSEDLIREALHPYDGLVVATKGGFTRHGPDVWKALGRAEYLRQCVLMSLRRLGVERIDLWQLHRIDPKVSRDEQFGVIADMQREGLIRHVGLSEVSVAD